jgi:hypothetical protein
MLLRRLVLALSLSIRVWNSLVFLFVLLDLLVIFEGGPGVEGVPFLIANGAGFSSITGGSYDIVSWDPRGVGSMTVSVRTRS